MSSTVSVVIPNYNHSRYLTKRIESVLAQTYQDFEIIILDDHSTDNSLQVISRYASNPRVSKILLNDAATGSPFKQWWKGIQEAKGAFVWIAESDDYAHPRFLETLVRKLTDNENVGLAYCRSWRVDADDNVIEVIEPWKAEEDRARWESDFVRKGVDEIRQFPLSGTNIHNTSAVLFRRALFAAVDKRFVSYRYSGDWLFFISSMLVTDIAYCAEPLNYYRWHPASVTARATGTPRGLVELYRITNYAARMAEIDPIQYRRVVNQWALQWALAINRFTLRQNAWILWEGMKVDRAVLARLAYLRLRPLGRAALGRVPSPVRRVVNRMRGIRARDSVEEHVRNGRIPWSPTYSEYHRHVIREAIESSSLLEGFKRKDRLPPLYGVGVDERCVEYPWLVVNLPKDARGVLDAGSALNYEDILKQPFLRGRHVTILTLAPEGSCFLSGRVSYIYADLRNIPIRDDSYDAIACISTLEHVGMNNVLFTQNSRNSENRPNDFVSAMREFRRILKPLGSLLLTVPYGAYMHMGMQQQFDRSLLSQAIDAFGRTARVQETFYRYTRQGWQQAEDSECSGSRYVEWISDVWRENVPIPRAVPIEPDLAAAARAVACVLLVKG